MKVLWLMTAALGLCLGQVACSSATAPEQPLAFSHAIHAGKEAIPCRRCHPGAARSHKAGLPPFNICLGCHMKPQGEPPTKAEAKVRELAAMKSPPRWIQVNRNETHVYFSHRAHVGIARMRCAECHGAVKKWNEPTRVPVPDLHSMDACMDCHRKTGASNECATCHR